MTAITWDTLETTLLAVIARSPFPYTVIPGDFATLLPQATSYAENRIYREMPMLAQRTQDSTLSTTGGKRTVSLKGTTLPVLVPERVAIVSGGTTYQCIPTSLDFLDMYWPAQQATLPPANATGLYWAIIGGVDSDFSSPTIAIAPTPDQTYTITVTGLFQQKPISDTNQQTYLSTVYPELLTAACLVWLSGALLRNYAAAGIPGGSAPDEPGMPVYWESQYAVLLKAAQAEEVRRRQQGTDWLDRPPAPPATVLPGRRTA